MLIKSTKKFWMPSIVPYYAAVGTSSPPVLTFVNTVNGGSNSGGVTTFTSANIGTAAGFTTRRIIVAIEAGAFAGPVTDVTIGGISATIHAQDGSQAGVAIASANVPTGTTATISVTQAAGTIFLTPTITIYSVDDALLVSTTPSTATGSTAAASSVASASFTETAGGFVIVVVGAQGPFGGTGCSISGCTTDGFGGAGNSEYYGSRASVSSTVTGPITANWTTPAAASIAVAAWR